LGIIGRLFDHFPDLFFQFEDSFGFSHYIEKLFECSDDVSIRCLAIRVIKPWLKTPQSCKRVYRAFSRWIGYQCGDYFDVRRSLLQAIYEFVDIGPEQAEYAIAKKGVLLCVNAIKDGPSSCGHWAIRVLMRLLQFGLPSDQIEYFAHEIRPELEMMIGGKRTGGNPREVRDAVEILKALLGCYEHFSEYIAEGELLDRIAWQCGHSAIEAKTALFELICDWCYQSDQSIVLNFFSFHTSLSEFLEGIVDLGDTSIRGRLFDAIEHLLSNDGDMKFRLMESGIADIISDLADDETCGEYVSYLLTLVP
jgi:hypothetical protein